MNWIELYAALGLSWGIVAVVRLGQRLGKVMRGEDVDYSHLSDAKAAARRERDAKMREDMSELVDIGVPAPALMAMMAAAMAVMAVPVALIVGALWPLGVTKHVRRSLRKRKT